MLTDEGQRLPWLGSECCVQTAVGIEPRTSLLRQALHRRLVVDEPKMF